MKNNINKIIKDYAAYYYNNYPPKQINKKRPYSFRASKKNNKNETSIYQKIEEERIVKKLYPPTKEKQKEKEKKKEKSKKSL